jgi:flagellar hook-length control protein FliK
MNATGLPIQAAAVTPAASSTEVAPTTTPGAQAPTDFVLALAQMLGTSIPATANAGAQASTTSGTRDPEVDTDASDAAAALSLLPLPIAQVQPQLAVAQKAETLDPLELLGLTTSPSSASARDAALLQALTDRVTAAGETPQEAQVQNGSLLTSEVSQARTGAPETAAANTRSLHSPVGTQAWADELGSRVTMMTNKGEHTASLRLSPEHLGPLEIRIAMREDQASVWFGAAHADTRAAIEHALPRLRELFAAQGMSLADAGVFREPPRQQMPGVQGARMVGSDADVDSAASIARVQVGLLDAYA